ncbi:hypothetical protein JCM15765_12820 [Paradesulfitobacterium aromaticivorans]
MTGEALGLIEAIGLPAAIAAADTAAKAANVRLLGYELTKGGGLVTVKLIGDVAAVKAAIEAGGAEAKRVHGLWAVHIIPRPASGITSMVLAEAQVSPAVSEEEKPPEKEPEQVQQTEQVQAQQTEQVQPPPKKYETRSTKRKPKSVEPENGK